MIYLAIMYVASLALAYVFSFTAATLLIGRSLGKAGTPTGYQDAVTPPGFTKIALLVYLAALAGIVYGFWRFGWVHGILIAVGLFVVAGINQALLIPKSGGPHFRGIVIRSMIRRHTDYIRDGDVLRATVMGELLEDFGIPVQNFAALTQKRDKD